MRRISSERFVRALEHLGFAVYRRVPTATILERGLRAVTVPERAELGCETVMDLRRMAGLTWRELDGALAATDRAGPGWLERHRGRPSSAPVSQP